MGTRAPREKLPRFSEMSSAVTMKRFSVEVPVVQLGTRVVSCLGASMLETPNCGSCVQTNFANSLPCLANCFIQIPQIGPYEYYVAA